MGEGVTKQGRTWKTVILQGIRDGPALEGFISLW